MRCFTFWRYLSPYTSSFSFVHILLLTPKIHRGILLESEFHLNISEKESLTYDSPLILDCESCKAFLCIHFAFTTPLCKVYKSFYNYSICIFFFILKMFLCQEKLSPFPVILVYSHTAIRLITLLTTDVRFFFPHTKQQKLGVLNLTQF